jgi:hypothetical protein
MAGEQHGAFDMEVALDKTGADKTVPAIDLLDTFVRAQPNDGLPGDGHMVA